MKTEKPDESVKASSPALLGMLESHQKQSWNQKSLVWYTPPVVTLDIHFTFSCLVEKLACLWIFVSAFLQIESYLKRTFNILPIWENSSKLPSTSPLLLHRTIRVTKHAMTKWSETRNCTQKSEFLSGLWAFLGHTILKMGGRLSPTQSARPASLLTQASERSGPLHSTAQESRPVGRMWFLCKWWGLSEPPHLSIHYLTNKRSAMAS